MHRLSLGSFTNKFSYMNQIIKLTLAVLSIKAATTIHCSAASQQGESTESDAIFSWNNHQDDHSFYSGRSLMSAANIQPRVRVESNSDASLNIAKEDYDIDLGPQNGALVELEDEHGALKTKDFVEKEWQLMFRSFDLMFDSVAGSSIWQHIGKHTNIFEEVVARLPAQCAKDIIHIKNSFKKHKLWAMRMVDSMGKFPSGVTYGRFASQGDFEECLAAQIDEYVNWNNVDKEERNSNNKNDRLSKQRDDKTAEHYSFRGKYCLIDFRLPLPERPKDKLLSVHEPVIDLSNTDLGRDYPIIKNYSGFASVFYEAGYLHAICLPNSCKVEDFTKSLGKSLEGIHIIVNNTIDCQVGGPEPLRKSQIISILLLSLIFGNALLASYSYASLKLSRKSQSQKIKDKSTTSDKNKVINNADTQKDSDKKQAGFLNILQSDFYIDCFSIQSNFQRLSKPDPRGLTFVHYTRIVAMALTVVTHTAALGTLQAITKPADASNSESMFRDLLPQMLANAFTSIQIFFFMAGFMLVISTYPSIKREKGQLPFVEYAIKRAIRLLPGIFATLSVNFLWP